MTGAGRFLKLGLTCGFPEHARGQRVIELKQLYTAPNATGLGIGGALMDWAMAEFAARGADEVQISVYTENHGAHRFYPRYGFEKVADITFEVGDHVDPEYLFARHALVRALNPILAYPVSFRGMAHWPPIRSAVTSTCTAMTDGTIRALTPIDRILDAVRSHLGMEIAFASRILDGLREFTHIRADCPVPVAPGEAEPLDQTLCGGA